METKVNLNMRNCALIFFLALILTSCEKCDKVVTHENVEQTIIALERQALDQWAEGNPLGFLVNFADDVTYFDDIAAQTRIDGLEAMRNYVATTLEGNIPPHKYELVNPKVQVYGDIAILTLQYHGSMANGDKDPPWKATSVYRWNEDKWRIVHAHWSLVKE